MYARFLALTMVFAGTTSVMAGELMKPEEARSFIAGKLFAFTCFEGTRGAGRIHADGSVVGSIQLQGSGAVRVARLPAGTLRVKGDAYCASLRGLSFEPCFNVNRTTNVSFRGSISGLGFAYCDFTRRGGRIDLAGTMSRPRPIKSAVVAPPAEE